MDFTRLKKKWSILLDSWEVAKHYQFSGIKQSPHLPFLSTAPFGLLSTSLTHHRKLMTREHRRQWQRLGWRFKAAFRKQGYSQHKSIEFWHPRAVHSSRVNQGKTGLDLPDSYKTKHQEYREAQADGIDSHHLLGIKQLSMSREKDQFWGNLNDIIIIFSGLPPYTPPCMFSKLTSSSQWWGFTNRCSYKCWPDPQSPSGREDKRQENCRWFSQDRPGNCPIERDIKRVADGLVHAQKT